MRVRAKGNIQSGGRSYGSGDILEVSLDDALSLARAGAIEELTEPEAETDEQAEPNS